MTIIKQEKIDVTQPSYIQPFATTSMIETFLMGVSPDVYATTLTELEKSLTNFAVELKEVLALLISSLWRHTKKNLLNSIEAYGRGRRLKLICQFNHFIETLLRF